GASIHRFSSGYCHDARASAVGRLLLHYAFCWDWTVCLQITLTTQGGVYQFELIDYYGANGICLLSVSLVQCVAVGWAFGAERIHDALEDMTGQRPGVFYTVCWRYVTPLICTVCFIGFFLDFQPLKTSDGSVYPNWAYNLGWAIAISCVVPIPICAVTSYTSQRALSDNVCWCCGVLLVILLVEKQKKNVP
ncbi:hypothetical protein KUCAC02_008403, partial [Chaenocephalus aceratus]